MRPGLVAQRKEGKLHLAAEVELAHPYAVAIKKVHPLVEIHEAVWEAGRWSLRGEIRWEILYVGVDGRIYQKELISLFRRHLRGARKPPRRSEGAPLFRIEPGPAVVTYNLEYFLGLHYGRRLFLEAVVPLQFTLFEPGRGTRFSVSGVQQETLRLKELVLDLRQEIMVEKSFELEHPAVAVIQVQSRPPLLRGLWAAERILVEGTLPQEIYFTDGGLVYSQPQAIPFDAVLDAPGSNDQMDISLSGLVRTLETELKADGKTLVERAIVAVRAKVTCPRTVAVVTELEAREPGISLQRTPLKAEVLVGEGQTELMLTRLHQLLVPAQAVPKITWRPPQITHTDLMTGQVIVEGNVPGELTIIGQDGVEYQESIELPFSALISVPGTERGTKSATQGRVTATHWELEAGGCRIDLRLTLQLSAVVLSEVTLTVLTEVRGEGLQVEKSHLLVEKIVAEKREQVLQERQLELPPDARELARILGEVVECRGEIFPGGILVQGQVEEQLVYFDARRAVRFLAQRYPFTHLLAIPGLDPGFSAQITAQVDHISYSAGGGGPIQERVIIGLSAQVTERVELDLVTGIGGPTPAVTAAGGRGSPVWAGEKRVTRSARVDLTHRPARQILEARALVHRLDLWPQGEDYQVGGEIIFQFSYVGRDFSLRFQEERVTFVQDISFPGAPPLSTVVLRGSPKDIRVGHWLALPPGEALATQVVLEVEFGLVFLAASR